VAVYSGDTNYSISTSAAIPLDQLPAWLSAGSAGDATWNAISDTLTVTGPITIIADPGSDEPNIVASDSAAVVSFNTGGSTGTEFHIGGLSLTNGASATVASLAGARTASNYNVLIVGVPGATAAPTFNIGPASNFGPASTLDLTDNDLIDLYGSAATPFTAIQGDIVQAYDGGNWDLPGLTSSAAGSNSGTYGLGYAEASTLGLSSFDGVTLGGNAVLVKFTLLGDANLDGTVNFNDFSLLQNHYGQAGDWSGGDFNYDGTVNFNDFSLLQNNYGKTLGGAAQ
jgi:hypothetical protein